LAERKRAVALVESVKDFGATVRLFSSLHISGDQLDQLGGVAAILRFPMPEIEEEDEEDDDEEEKEGEKNVNNKWSYILLINYLAYQMFYCWL